MQNLGLQLNIRFSDYPEHVKVFMLKLSCNNLFISYEDVEIYQLWEVFLMHCY